jgi:outer membrane protein OmpA-like peptidoglycan-associated protein
MPRVQVMSSRWNGTQWNKGQEVESLNDKKYHVGNVSFSADGDKAVFTRCTDDKGAEIHCDICLSEKQGDWSSPEVLSFNDKKFTNTHPTFASIRGKEAIIFASDREGTTGGMDLWYTTFERGSWQMPRNLGRKINTWGDEITPYFDFEEEVLYFSSNGNPNVGGHDVFKSKISGTRWATPINMGFPLNSCVDDMYYTHNSKRDKGFIVSNRVGSIALKSPTCCDDIWSFEVIIPPVFWIMGNVYLEGDRTMTPIPDANVDLYYLQADTTLDIRVSSSDTLFGFFRGTEYENFRLEATKQGYIRGNATTSTVGLGPEDDTVYVNLYLKQIDTGIIVLRNLYFDLDKANIRKDAEPSLDTVLQILRKNPNIQIELASHTDCRDTYDYNIDLSQRRADSSKAWLVRRGIPEDRIVAVGYGETKLLNECECEGNKVVPCTDLQHQVNRRTEFRVLGEIPGAIVKYDKSEVDYAIKHGKEITTGGTNQTLWNFEDEPEEPEEPEEAPQQR